MPQCGFRRGPRSATIVGGTGAVTSSVESGLAALGTVVDHLAGSDRYTPSLAVAAEQAEVGADRSRVWLATGRNWPDALAAGPAAARDGGTLLLVDGYDRATTPETFEWLTEQGVQSAWLLGGPDVNRPLIAQRVNSVD